MICNCGTRLSTTGKLGVLALIGLALLYPTIFYFGMTKYSIHIKEYFGKSELKNYLIDTKGCRIPKFHPFDPSVSIYFYEKSSPIEDCYTDAFLLVDKNTIILNTHVTDEKFENQTLNCTYQPIIRDPYNSSTTADFNVILGDAKPLIFGEPLEDEFVKVKCSIGNYVVFIDYLALLLIKPDVEKRCNLVSANLALDPLNVIIIGIDSVSKLNFLRHFPMTNGLLKTTLKPFEFHGHSKVADNTFPNLVSMLTGHFVSHYERENDIEYTYLDNLDLIWKEFSALGYRTFYIEDSPNINTFSLSKQGFKRPPTDYYLRPFAIAVEKTYWRTKNGEYCYGQTSETEFFYNYFRDFVSLMDKRPFFAFTYITRPTHDHLNTAGYADKPTFILLRNLIETNVLNNSALIFFSDHGIRFGHVLESYIGKVEERMPFMFQHYPEWFLKQHEGFRRALTINQKRLTTPFDVHKTLQDIAALSSKTGTVNTKLRDNYGQSLFCEISEERTCEDAHLTPHWCTCLNKVRLMTYGDKAIELSEGMINIINNLTNSTGLCAELHLVDIVNVFVTIPKADVFSATKSMDKLYYLATAKAAPGNAVFEGTFQYVNGELQALGEISRINSYGNQSWCVQDPGLKKYCFCNNSSNIMN